MGQEEEVKDAGPLCHLKYQLDHSESDHGKAAAFSYNRVVASVEEKKCIACGYFGHLEEECPMVAQLKLKGSTDKVRLDLINALLTELRAKQLKPI